MKVSVTSYSYSQAYSDQFTIFDAMDHAKAHGADGFEFAGFDVPEGMTKEDAEMAAGEDLQAYREELESRSNAAREAAVPRCATGIRASEHYGIDNQWTQKLYDLLRELDDQNEALQIKITKFDASLDIDVRLGVDPRKANQMVRGVVTLPNGTGKTVRVLVLCTPDAEAAAKAAGADYVGLEEYIEKIKGGWTDVDVIITQPQIMGKIGALGRILGPRGLMPNPKSGTVTPDVAKAVEEVKKGKIDFKVDKNGIIHSSIGKVSFTAQQMVENAREFINTLIKLKPATAKGTYIKSIYLSSTMSPGVKVDPKSVEA